MRTIVVIIKRGQGYISKARGQFNQGHTGARCGTAPYEAAAKAVHYMIKYAQSNPEGGDLTASPEVLELIPEHLRNVPASIPRRPLSASIFAD